MANVNIEAQRLIVAVFSCRIKKPELLFQCTPGQDFYSVPFPLFSQRPLLLRGDPSLRFHSVKCAAPMFCDRRTCLEPVARSMVRFMKGALQEACGAKTHSATNVLFVFFSANATTTNAGQTCCFSLFPSSCEVLVDH